MEIIDEGLIHPEELLGYLLRDPLLVEARYNSRPLLVRLENQKGNWTVAFSGLPSTSYFLKIISFFDKDHPEDGLKTLIFNFAKPDMLTFENVAGSLKKSNIPLLAALKGTMENKGYFRKDK